MGAVCQETDPGCSDRQTLWVSSSSWGFLADQWGPSHPREPQINATMNASYLFQFWGKGG